MKPIWWFTPYLSDEPDLQRLERRCRFATGEDTIRVRPDAHEIAPSNFSTARLELTLENFSLDCFYWVDCRSLHPYMFVSEALRDAMALDSRDVQYLTVNTRLSAPLPRSKNYMVMHPPAIEAISEPDKSIYLNKYIADALEKPMAPGRIAVRHDADPKHDIFRDRFFSAFIFCTDSLAVRVLQRQCSGVRFVDPEHLDDPMRFRSLRGIEEERWDAAQDVSQPVSGDSAIAEANHAADNNPHTGNNSIYTDYGGRIRGVQFAAVPIPMGSLGITRAVPAGWTNLTRLADGSFRLGTGETITATRLLNAVDRGRDRDAVRSALTRFQLISRRAADVLAARAYVWSNNFAPWNFADVPESGSALESVSRSIMQVELARPGTLYLALQGDRLSTIYIRTAAEEGLSDAHLDLA
jgi:hypothetical protein